MARLLRLTLQDFRSYQHLSWQPQARLCVVCGPNGTGKTNLLEAVSLLAPGRGLRGARIGELGRAGGPGPWGVAARLLSGGSEVDIGTGTLPGGPERRVFRLDGLAPRSQADIARHVSAVWLTPQMDRLFQEGASGRRRFLDRLVWALEPSHARELASHESAMLQRNRLLARSGSDGRWLDALEDSLARHAVAVAAGRAGLVSRLNAALSGAGGAGRFLGAFPAAALALHCPVADRLRGGSALDAEDWLRGELARRRGEDAAAGHASLGAHRGDMGLHERDSGLAASLASTGQQKAMLVAVVLGHVALIRSLRGDDPMLLLDEPLVHLDSGRRRALLDALREGTGQVLLTGTDADGFAPLRGAAAFLRTGDGGLSPDDGAGPDGAP